MSICINPTNQPIYNALMAEANSYSDNELEQAMAYREAAKAVAISSYDLYKGNVSSVTDIGPDINEFINDFIKMFPTTESYITLCNYIEKTKTTTDS